MLMNKGTNLQVTTSISVAVAAIMLGKAVLIADMLPVINRYPDKPLIYNVGWKTMIYLLLSAVIHYLERLFDFWRQAGDSSPATRNCSRKSFGRISGRSRSSCSC